MKDITLTDGSPVTPDHREIDPKTGQQKAYVVLSAAERAQGFIRPVRNSYKHVGHAGPKHELRYLNENELTEYKQFGYVAFEKYPENDSSVTGRYWTQKQLDTVRKGCGVVTRMGMAIAETYARDPKFYGGTFCCGCNTHLPVHEFHWDGTEEEVGS